MPFRELDATTKICLICFKIRLVKLLITSFDEVNGLRENRLTLFSVPLEDPLEDLVLLLEDLSRDFSLAFVALSSSVLDISKYLKLLAVMATESGLRAMAARLQFSSWVAALLLMWWCAFSSISN